MGAPGRVIDRLEAQLAATIDELAALSRIPSVSAPGFPLREVERCAEAVAGTLRGVGLENVELIDFPGSPPYVVADWLRAGAERPTVLLYAHYDVQPPGREKEWLSPPFVPTERDGRLFGRGVADDKAGVMVFVAAIRAWLESEGALPLNVKLVIEGEEEIGSENLEAFLRSQRERLACDVIVLTDTANLETGLPSLTTSLRGLVNLDLRVRTLDHPLHSGLWGGPVADAGSALAVLLARLFDADGRVAIPGFEADVVELGPERRAELAALPFDEASFRTDAGMSQAALFSGDPSASVYERIWWRPALSITALEAMPLAEATNQLVDTAAARISVRLAPGQDAVRMRDLVIAHLSADPPFGASVEVTCRAAGPGWCGPSAGPAIDAARRALSEGYGRSAVLIGCGGSIPFVGPFSEVLTAPALLMGLEDPICNAHGENESLHLGDFRSACRAAAHILAELSHLERT